MKRAFLDKLLRRLRRLQPEEMEAFFIELARDKRLFETIFNAIREGVIVTDRAGTVTYLNQAACALFGIDAASALGRPLADRISGLDWKSLAQGSDVVTRDIEVFYPENRLLNFYVAPLMGEEGEQTRTQHIGYAIILRDFTENRRAARETLETERLAALKLLAAGVAHEIGNPLNSLTIHLQLLERRIRRLPEEWREGLAEPVAVARDEIRRLDHIVTQFLRAIRPAPLQLAPQNLNDLVHEAIDFLGPEMKSRDIRVELDLTTPMPLIEADHDQLKQAFFNVIKNAREAMPSGGTLRVHTAATPEHVAVTFSDTGGGMSAEAMSRVFEPYFTTKADGSGLGLMVVQRIIRAHGGEIAIESSAGRGVSLTLRLPRHERQVRMLEAGATARNAAPEAGAARNDGA